MRNCRQRVEQRLQVVDVPVPGFDELAVIEIEACLLQLALDAAGCHQVLDVLRQHLLTCDTRRPELLSTSGEYVAIAVELIASRFEGLRIAAPVQIAHRLEATAATFGLGNPVPGATERTLHAGGTADTLLLPGDFLA